MVILKSSIGEVVRLKLVDLWVGDKVEIENFREDGS